MASLIFEKEAAGGFLIHSFTRTRCNPLLVHKRQLPADTPSLRQDVLCMLHIRCPPEAEQ
jgi:hypothetical protein